MTDVLIERADFLASLQGLLGEALGGHGRLVFVGGEAGVGKTTLAAALADTVAGPAVRRGSCDNVTTAEALGPILDALPELAAAVDQEPGVSRLRLFRQVRDTLAGSPMVLVLEDVHWADEATLDILRFLGRRLDGARLMIVATFRSEEVGGDHPLTVVMGDLAPLPGVVRMQLPALSADGVRQLLAGAGSALDAADVFQRTGGNPFYVTEVLAAGAGPVPATVSDAVLARVSRLSPAARMVVGSASLLGRSAEVGLLTAVSEQPLTAVDECLNRGVLVAGDGTVSFRHDLARLAVERSLPQAQRADIHARALARLVASGSADHRRLAHHGAGSGDRDAVLRHAPIAAARAARFGAHREAADQLRLALRFHATPDRLRAGLLDQLSYECYLTDQVGQALASGLEALASYEQEQDMLAVGSAQRWLSRLSWVLGHNGESERYAAAAVATLESREPDRELAMAYSNLAQLRMLAGDGREAVRLGTKAIELAREVGDREVETHALNNVGTALSLVGDLIEGRTRLTQSLDLALADDAHEHVARAYTNLGSVAAGDRSFDEADGYLQAGIAYCTDRDLDTWRLYMSAWLARSLAEQQGRYAAADQHLADILRHPHLSPITRVSALPVAGVLAARRGAGLLRRDGGRAGVPGRAGPARRPSRSACGAAGPARPGPDRTPRSPACQPGEPGGAHGARDRGAWPARRRAVLRRGGRTAHLVREDGGSPCLRRAAQAQRADPRQSGRRGAAPRGHPAKIGNTPDVPPGPDQVCWSRGHGARDISGEDIPMALFMDTHALDGPVSIDDVAKAHCADLKTQEAYGVHYLRYWVDQEHGRIFCLVDAPDADAAAAVHREAHGLVADAIYPVTEGA